MRTMKLPIFLLLTVSLSCATSSPPVPQSEDDTRPPRAFAKKKAGDLTASRALWVNMLQTTSSPHMQDLAERMITDIDATLQKQPEDPGVSE